MRNGKWHDFIALDVGSTTMNIEEEAAEFIREETRHLRGTRSRVFAQLIGDLERLKDIDPDKGPPMAECWLPWCPLKPIVPMGVRTAARFGEWGGPPTLLADVPLFFRRLGSTKEGRIAGLEWWHGRAEELVLPGHKIVVVRLTVPLDER